MYYPRSLATLTLILLSGLFPYTTCGPHEHRLLEDIFKSYVKEERPVSAEDERLHLPLDLTVGLELQQIINLDEKDQVLTTNMWLNLAWRDANLRWNKTEYGGLSKLFLPSDRLWTPDLLLYNSASEAFETTYHTNIVVTSDGSCSYIPPGIFQSTCQIDIRWFPFDDQSCLFKFSSWTYDSSELNLTLKSDIAEMGGYIENGEWELLDFPGKRNEQKYDCCPNSYVDLSYHLKIRRRTLYYFTNLILPCGVIAVLAIIGFCVPPDCGEKVTLEITVLMALTFYMNMVSEMMPQSSETPLIGIYFSSIMIMVATSVAATVLILNYQHTVVTNSEMPRWTRKVFLQWLPWMLRISRSGKKVTRKAIQLQNKMRELEKTDSSSMSLLSNVLDFPDDYLPQLNTISTKACSSSLVDDGPAKQVSEYQRLNNPRDCQSVNKGYQEMIEISGSDILRGHNHLFVKECRSINLDFHRLSQVNDQFPGQASAGLSNIAPPSYPLEEESKLGEILKEIRVITDKIKDEEESESAENEWKFAAMVLDRLCLFLFSVLSLVLTMAIFMAAPHLIVW